MLTRRIIPCLDVKNGRVVKGVNFVSLRDAGDPVEAGEAYSKAGADELVFLDITATSDARATVTDMVRRVAQRVFIPFTVGGGIRSVDDMKAILREGADKISVNSAAVERPELIAEGAERFGSQCIVTAIDARRRVPEEGRAWEPSDGWTVYTAGGRHDTGLDAVAWGKEGGISWKRRASCDQHGLRRNQVGIRYRSYKSNIGRCAGSRHRFGRRRNERAFSGSSDRRRR